jgi:hypothetical protein
MQIVTLGHLSTVVTELPALNWAAPLSVSILAGLEGAEPAKELSHLRQALVALEGQSIAQAMGLDPAPLEAQLRGEFAAVTNTANWDWPLEVGWGEFCARLAAMDGFTAISGRSVYSNHLPDGRPLVGPRFVAPDLGVGNPVAVLESVRLLAASWALPATWGHSPLDGEAVLETPDRMLAVLEWLEGLDPEATPSTPLCGGGKIARKSKPRKIYWDGWSTSRRGSQKPRGKTRRDKGGR